MPLSNERVLVTGAGGFVGGRLVDLLLREGVATAALVRTGLESPRLQALGCATYRGDVTLPETLPAAVRGCTALVHCAVGGADLEESRRVNVAGTVSLLRAFAEAGGRRVVHVSSVAVHGTQGLPDLVTEDEPVVKEGSPYEMSKAEGEVAALQVGGELGLEVVVIRPTLIYGPGSRQWTLGLLERVRYDSVRLIDGGLGTANLIYIDDLCGLLRGALVANADAVGAAYFASGPDLVTWRDLLGAYARMLDKPEPANLPMARARLAYKAALLRHKSVQRPLVIGPFDMEAQRQRAVFSTEKAKRLLAYSPAYPFERGMEHTRQWLYEKGYLPRRSVNAGGGSASRPAARGT